MSFWEISQPKTKTKKALLKLSQGKKKRKKKSLFGKGK